MKPRTTNYFEKQVNQLSLKDLNLLEEKYQLIQQNPFRYKRLKSKYSLFRVRVSIAGKSMRLIYTIKNGIIIICLLERKDGYKNLDAFIKKLLQ